MNKANVKKSLRQTIVEELEGDLTAATEMLNGFISRQEQTMVQMSEEGNRKAVRQKERNIEVASGLLDQLGDGSFRMRRR